MAQRSYVVMALVDNIEWVSWKDIERQTETSVPTGVVYAGDFPDEINAARESAAGLQAFMDVLQAKGDDGSLVYYPGDALPSMEITPWPTLMEENDPHSVSAADYGITYTADNMPDWYTWDTVPLSYLCAYYLNADGAYAEAAMDVLARRYQQEIGRAHV